MSKQILWQYLFFQIGYDLHRFIAMTPRHRSGYTKQTNSTKKKQKMMQE